MTQPLDALTIAALRQQVVSLMPTWQIDDLGGFHYLSGGYSNSNYRFAHRAQQYVLRIPLARQPFVDRAHEAAWYQRLPEHIGVKPIALDPHSGCMISPWIEGRLLVDAWPTLSISDLATYLVQLHKGLPPDPRRYDIKNLSQAYLGETPVAVPRLSMGHLITCHNDLNPWNIIVTPRGWITLDWEFVGLNDPLFDLVSLHQGLALPPAELPDIAGQYLGTFSDQLANRLIVAQHHFWLREMAWATFQIKTGNTRPEIIEQEVLAKEKLANLKPR